MYVYIYICASVHIVTISNIVSMVILKLLAAQKSVHVGFHFTRFTGYPVLLDRRPFDQVPADAKSATQRAANIET